MLEKSFVLDGFAQYTIKQANENMPEIKNV